MMLVNSIPHNLGNTAYHRKICKIIKVPPRTTPIHKVLCFLINPTNTHAYTHTHTIYIYKASNYIKSVCQTHPYSYHTEFSLGSLGSLLRTLGAGWVLLTCLGEGPILPPIGVWDRVSGSCLLPLGGVEVLLARMWRPCGMWFWEGSRNSLVVAAALSFVLLGGGTGGVLLGWE